MAKQQAWMINYFVCTNGQETYIIKNQPFTKCWHKIKMLAFEKIKVHKHNGKIQSVQKEGSTRR